MEEKIKEEKKEWVIKKVSENVLEAIEKTEKERKENEKEIFFEISKIEILLENFVSSSTKKKVEKVMGEEMEYFDSSLLEKKKEMDESVNYLSVVNHLCGESKSLSHPLSLALFQNFSLFSSSFQKKSSQIESLRLSLSSLQSENKKHLMLLSQQKDQLASKQNKINSLLHDLASQNKVSSSFSSSHPSTSSSSTKIPSPYSSNERPSPPSSSSNIFFENSETPNFLPALLPVNSLLSTNSPNNLNTPTPPSSNDSQMNLISFDPSQLPSTSPQLNTNAPQDLINFSDSNLPKMSFKFEENLISNSEQSKNPQKTEEEEEISKKISNSSYSIKVMDESGEHSSVTLRFLSIFFQF